MSSALEATVYQRLREHLSYLELTAAAEHLDCSGELWFKRRSYGDVVDLAFNRETERAQLWQPRFAIFVVNEREDADHPGLEVAGDARSSALVSPINHIGSSVLGRMHMLLMRLQGKPR
jgi:hypothetical protein